MTIDDWNKDKADAYYSNATVNPIVTKEPVYDKPKTEFEPTPPSGEVDWDYTNATTDIRGNVPLSYKLGDWTLSPDGFDPNGNLYFGKGVSGWFKKLAYKSLATAWGNEQKFDESKKRVSEGFKKLQDAQYFDFSLTNPLDEAAMEEAQTKTTEESGKITEGLTDVIAGLWGTAVNSDSALAIPLKGVNLAAEAAIDVFQAFADTTESVLAMNKTMRKYVEENGGSPPIAEFDFDPITIAGDYAITDELLNTFVRGIVPLLGGYDAVRFWQAPGTFEEKTEALKQGWYEGRMLYSELVHPAVEEEFKRRMLQPGANPDLIAMELQDPFAELVGEFVLDPLNLIASGARVAKFEKIVTEAEKIGGVIDDAVAVLKNTPSTPAQASAATDKLVESIQNFGYNENGVQKVIGGLEYSPNSLTSKGMVTKQTKNMSEFITWMGGAVSSKGGSPDDLADGIAALVKLSSKNADEVKAGISYVKGSEFVGSPLRFFGQQALETSHMLRNLMGEGDDTLKLIEKIKGSTWDEQAEIVSKLLNNAAKANFPPVQEMAQSASKVAAGAGTAKDARLAEMYKEVVKKYPGLETLSKFDNEISKIFKNINPIFSNLYFSRYGFATRQAISNSFMVFKEGGVKAFVRDGQWKSISSIKEELAAAFPAGLPEVLKQKSYEATVDVADNFITAAFKRFKNWEFSPQSLAAKVEQEAGMRLFYKFYRDTMDKMAEFGVVIPKMEDWTARGFSAEQAADWQNIYKSNGYDPNVTNRIFKQKYENGVEMYRDLGWVSEDIQKGIREYGGWDEIMRFVNDPAPKTPTQIQKFFQDMIDGIAEKSATHLDPNGVSKERALEHIDQFESPYKEMRSYGDIQTHVSNADNAAREAFKYDMQNAMANVRKQITQLSDVAAQGGKLKPDQVELMKTLNSWLGKAEQHLNDAEEIYRHNGEILKELKRDLDAWMKENKVYKYGDAPREAKWQEWYAAVEKAREDYFNFYNGGGIQIADDYAKLTGDVKAFDRAREATVQVQNAKNVVSGVNGGIFNTLPSSLKYSVVGDAGHEENVYQLANAYGIRTSTNVHGGNSKYKDIIKYIKLKATPEDLAKLPENFTLKDIPLEMAEKYFAEKSGIKMADGSLYNVVGRLKRQGTSVMEQMGLKIDPSKAAADAEEIKNSDFFKDLKAKAKAARGGAEVPQNVSRQVVDDVKGLLPAKPIHAGGTAGFSEARAWSEGSEKLAEALRYIEQGMLERFGRRGPAVDAEQLRLLKEFEKDIAARAADAKLTATKVGSYYRDFGLHAYGEETNLEHALSFVYPYHFWYSRTYANFARSLVTNADMIAGYGKLKDFMANLYADQPEWFKYNVKFPDFFGTNNGNPYMFNLENAIWPLQGITGVDFNDPEKRTNWFTATVDDLGKFGPSVWTPVSMAIASYYLIKGEKDIASKWGTRFAPQTATAKAISSYFGTPIELDPNVQLFSGEGLGDFQAADPYEEGRIARALSAMEAEGYPEEQLIEAARTHSGPIWEEAYQRAVQQRAPGQLLSSMLGVAFRPRTEADIEIDNFYSDLHRMRELHDNGLLSDEQYKQGYDQLRERYSFMDTILLSRRAGIGREEGYAFNVMSRIPPGMSDEVLEAAGVDPETARKFYDSGGKTDGMTETEKQKFLASMVDVGSILAIPSTATRQQWAYARSQYGDMEKTLQLQFGEGILDKMGLYFGEEDKDKARLYLDSNPDVEQALQMKDFLVTQNPVLSQYYGGIDALERYYNSKMYDYLEEKYGSDLVDAARIYSDNSTTQEMKQEIRAQFPKLFDYWDEKAYLKDQNLRKLVEFGAKLPDAPELEARGDLPENLSPDQQALLGLTQPPPQVSFDQWAGILGPDVTDQILDYWYNQRDLNSYAERELEYTARQYGMDKDELLQQVLISLQD